MEWDGRVSQDHGLGLLLQVVQSVTKLGLLQIADKKLLVELSVQKSGHLQGRIGGQLTCDQNGDTCMDFRRMTGLVK